MSLREALAPAALAGLSLWRRLVPAPLGAFRILLFHDIPDMHREAFIALIDHIARTDGFITPAEAALRLQGTTGASDAHVPCLISFDDGFASNRQIADTVLAAHGVKALFFICPAIVDLPPGERPHAVAQGIFDGRLEAHGSKAERALMGWDDIRALHAAGHELGAHSMTHRRLAGLDTSALKAEVNGSCARLAEILGRPPDWFAWPFGDIGSIDASALAAIGRSARLCRSGVRGLNHPGQHRLVIFADHVDLAASTAWQKLVIAGGLDRRYHAARVRLAHLAEAAGYVRALP